MRISNSMIGTQVTGNLSAAMDRIYKLQNQASSGKRITQSSDDPMGTSQSLSLRGTVAGIDQYTRNVTQAKAQLSSMDNALDNINKALQETKRIGLAGANATVDGDQRKNLSVQVQQQMDNILREINTSYQDRQIFSGYKTDDKPVTGDGSVANPYKYNGDDGVTVVQVNDSTQVGITLTARQVLNFDGAADSSQPDTLTVLAGLRDALASGDQDGIQKGLKQLDSASQNVVSERGKMGARAQQMDVYGSRLADAKLTMTDWLSQVEDADVAETLTSLQQEQNVYQAALIATSRMIQPNLADFLK